MASCSSCGKAGFGFLEIKNGQCPSCRRQAEALEQSMTAEEKQAAADQREATLVKAKHLLVTTETWIGDVERLDVVATEVVFGMNIFKDLFAAVRDIVGGRSGVVQQTLDDARKIAFEELRLKASELGADAVIATKIDYHSISNGGGLNMMMVAVSGTAVKTSTD